MSYGCSFLLLSLLLQRGLLSVKMVNLSEICVTTASLSRHNFASKNNTSQMKNELKNSAADVGATLLTLS